MDFRMTWKKVLIEQLIFSEFFTSIFSKLKVKSMKNMQIVGMIRQFNESKSFIEIKFNLMGNDDIVAWMSV